MTVLFYAILFVFGLIVGSFLNVLVLRYDPEGKLFDSRKLRGRSRCPHCGRELSPPELVPILSFLFQGGKCRKCGHKLTFQYPIVEFLSAAIFSGVPLFLNGFYNVSSATFTGFGLDWWYYALLLLWVGVFLALLVIAAIDLREYLIPNELNLLLAVFGIAIGALVLFFGDKIFPFRESFLQQYQLIFSPFVDPVLNRLLGMAVAGSFFGLLVFLSRGRGMGMGDVKLAAASGLILGWPDIGFATMSAFIFGGIIGGALLFRGKKHIKDKLPFAPFFVLGIVATVFFSFGIMAGYFKLFSV
jgi:prepilin signal peptidase PulO-like enzyme (type II secretory pathway)